LSLTLTRHRTLALTCTGRSHERPDENSWRVAKLTQHRSPHRTHTLDASGVHRSKTQGASHEDFAPDANSDASGVTPDAFGVHLTQPQRVSPRSDLSGRNTPVSRWLLFLSPVPQLGRVRPHTGRVRPERVARKDPQLLPLLPCANTKVSQHLCSCVSIFQKHFSRVN